MLALIAVVVSVDILFFQDRGVAPRPIGGGEWVGTLQPDRLAELHAVRELSASSELALGA